MQSVPKEIDVEEVQKAIEGAKGVLKVHDLHVWAVTSGIFTLSAHVVTKVEEDLHRILNDIERILRDRFNIEHTTIQLEMEDGEARKFQAF